PPLVYRVCQLLHWSRQPAACSASTPSPLHAVPSVWRLVSVTSAGTPVLVAHQWHWLMLAVSSPSLHRQPCCHPRSMAQPREPRAKSSPKPHRCPMNSGSPANSACCQNRPPPSTRP